MKVSYFFMIVIIVVGIIVWALMPANKRSGQTRNSETKNWFTQSHDTLRSVGGGLH